MNEMTDGIVTLNYPYNNNFILEETSNLALPFNSYQNTIKYNSNEIETEMNVKPFSNIVKKMFPFIIEISKLIQINGKTLSYKANTFTPIIIQSFEIVVALTPNHYAEVFCDDGIRETLENTITENLKGIIKCMYNPKDLFDIRLIFEPKNCTQTLLEEIRKVSYN